MRREPLTLIAGIGSRRTPPVVLRAMQSLAADFVERDGCYIRSGGAFGADTAF